MTMDMTKLPCPQCGGQLGAHPAISRNGNETLVCAPCGTGDVQLTGFGSPDRPFDELMDEVNGRPTAESKIEAAVDLYFMNESMDSDHYFTSNFDGDGWNEPLSSHYECSCGWWLIEWVQQDPEQSDRPSSAEALVSWMKHVEAEVSK